MNTARPNPPRQKLPRERVQCADNLPFMAALPNSCCQLIYIDPPFMTNTVRTQAGGPRYDDRWRGGVKTYLTFLGPRLQEMHRLLDDRGTLYVHIDPRVGAHVRLLLDDIFGPRNFLNEIVWSYRTGGGTKRWFARKHDTIFAYAKRLGAHIFNVQRDGAYRTEGMRYDESGRPYKTTRKGRLYFHSDGPALTDVWEIPFLSTVARERTGYPTQKPEALLERIVQASSEPGALVADFFCGSGTTLAVAQRLKRSWLGCDASPEAVEITQQRLGEGEAPAEPPGQS